MVEYYLGFGAWDLEFPRRAQRGAAGGREAFLIAVKLKPRGWVEHKEERLLE